MYVRFWGTRGSIAAPGRHTARFGGNTSCVEIRGADGTVIVLDCGTGARDLGLHLLQGPRPLRVHLLIGHTHWDHIQGFPFFGPAFDAGAEVNVFAPLGFQRSLGEAMAGQMEYAYFPVKLSDLRSRIHFTELEEGFFRIGDVLVETQYLNHTAPTIAYRLSNGNATICYVTDHEPYWRPEQTGFEHPGDQRHIAFMKGADLVIHDAQYSDEEYGGRVGWGHSPIGYATDVTSAAGARRLALFHHDPTHDDDTLARLEAEARARVTSMHGTLDVFAAPEGLELDVKGERRVWAVPVASAFRRLPIAGRRVAVVSDDEEEIAAIEQELAEDRLVMLAVGSAVDAVDRMRELRPDLVIVSSRLADGDGAALVGPVRDALGRPDFPVILLTDDDADASCPAADAAPTDYLARPFSPPMLRARVRAWLSRWLSEESAAPIGEPDEAGVAEHTGSAEKYAGTLAAMSLFRSVPRDQLVDMALGAFDQAYPRGHVIVRESAPTESLFVIVEGRVRVTEAVRDAHGELLLSELGPGEIFGELGVLRDQPRVASVVALERTECIVLRSSRFMTTVAACPKLAMGLLQVLAARLSDADRRIARHAPDPLTGLMSRRTFDDQYRRLVAGVRRRQTGALVLVVDVRNLKAVNDRDGYGAGDQVLKATASALLQTTRSSDLVARYGGDEFVVLLVDVESQDAESVVARLREKFAAAAVRQGLPEGATWTIGAAHRSVPPELVDDMIREADADLRRRRRTD